MNINMPVLNGLEITGIIKADPSTKNIPILMFTAEGEKDAVIQAIQVGAEDYSIKTQDKKFVLQRIEKYFET